MKKIFNTALLLICSLAAFTSCDDDRDSNPTLIQPQEFVVNTPAYAQSEIDLAHSASLPLTWSQPVYTTDNAPVFATYEVQISPTGSFTVSTEEAAADESGATRADYARLDETTTLCKVDLSAEAVAKALIQVTRWQEDAVPALQDCYIRVRASVSGLNPIVSNVVKLSVIPYYIELKDAPVEMWYLIGSCIGDGKWSNSPDAVGTSLYPMAVDPAYEYDKKTGKGMLYFTGYLTIDGFKLIQNPGSWDHQWGSSDNGLTGVKDDGGSANFFVPENGYYKISLDTKNDKIGVEPLDIAPAVYESMMIAGDFNGWSEGTLMTPVNTVESLAGHNHIWTFELDLEADGGVKFLQPGWSPNWGSAAFPYGQGTNGGDNIPVKAGKWRVVFNDIDGTYSFIAL